MRGGGIDATRNKLTTTWCGNRCQALAAVLRGEQSFAHKLQRRGRSRLTDGISVLARAEYAAVDSQMETDPVAYTVDPLWRLILLEGLTTELETKSGSSSCRKSI